MISWNRWKVGSPEATWVNADTNPEEEKVELPHCFATFVDGSSDESAGSYIIGTKQLSMEIRTCHFSFKV